jgi:hypothetical protein
MDADAAALAGRKIDTQAGAHPESLPGRYGAVQCPTLPAQRWGMSCFVANPSPECKVPESRS